MTAVIVGKTLLWVIAIGAIYIALCWLDYWLGKVFGKRG